MPNVNNVETVQNRIHRGENLGPMYNNIIVSFGRSSPPNPLSAARTLPVDPDGAVPQTPFTGSLYNVHVIGVK